jgi:hypothetical protein
MKFTEYNIKDVFEKVVYIFDNALGKVENEILPFQLPAHNWRNLYYKTESLRHAHIEYYETDKMTVLHINCFPSIGIDLPILGLDIISIGGKITGLFFDITPVITIQQKYVHSLKELKQKVIESKHRNLPEWADFFSEHFLCIVPAQTEFKHLLDNIENIINLYIKDVIRASDIWKHSIKIQNNYCKGQKKNDKTFKALSAEIGSSSATVFFDNYLFPELIF